MRKKKNKVKITEEKIKLEVTLKSEEQEGKET